MTREKKKEGEGKGERGGGGCKMGRIPKDIMFWGWWGGGGLNIFSPPTYLIFFFLFFIPPFFIYFVLYIKERVERKGKKMENDIYTYIFPPYIQSNLISS